jgi:hypothetical protein
MSPTSLQVATEAAAFMDWGRRDAAWSSGVVSDLCCPMLPEIDPPASARTHH